MPSSSPARRPRGSRCLKDYLRAGLGIARCLALVQLLMQSGVHARTGAEPAPLKMSEVAPGIYVQFGAQEDWQASNAGNVANIGFIVGSRCVAVIDTGGSLQVGRQLRAAVAKTTRLPVCYVINTHAHPDHVLGNAAFVERVGRAAPAGTAERPAFVGHAKLSAALSARERYYLNALRRDFGQTPGPDTIVYPTVTVDKTIDLDLGGRTITLHAWPTAHTDHDLTVYDRSTKTLFLSDLLFVRHIPVLDGKLRGWLAVMEELRGFDVAVAIPGHGPAGPAWLDSMKVQERYLQALLRETKSAIKAGVTIQQAAERVAQDAARSWLLAGSYHRRNVTAAYAELEWED